MEKVSNQMKIDMKKIEVQAKKDEMEINNETLKITKNAEKETAIDIQNQNEKIITLEEKKRPEFAEKLKNELKLKREELVDILD